MAGFPLTGVDPADPIPGIIREIKFAQGQSSNASKERMVALIGNKTTAGSETVETVGDPIQSDEDCIERFGQKSEMYLMYKSYVAIDQNATIYGVAPDVGTGVSTVDWTFSGTATAAHTCYVDCIGETISIGIANGDAAATVAANVKSKIDEQLHWPVSPSVASAVLTTDASMAGFRHEYPLIQMRIRFSKSAGIAVAKGALTPGTADDDHTNAIDALRLVEIYYQANAKATAIGAHSLVSPSSSDGGVGEHAAMITSMALPSSGKGEQAFFPHMGNQGDATTLATAVNNARCKFVRAENNDWTPGMVVAHHMAAIRSKQIAHPSANLTDYGLGEGEIYNIPPPYVAADRPTESEIRADLNNGVTPIDWKMSGQGYVVRDITSRSLSGSFNDYRVREGHIPSAIDYYWETLFVRYFTSKQDFIASDPPAGEPPLDNTTYPRDVVALHSKLVDDLIDFVGGPVLDPDYRDQMKSTFSVVRLTDGLSARGRPIASKHNNKGQFLIEEASEAY